MSRDEYFDARRTITSFPTSHHSIFEPGVNPSRRRMRAGTNTCPWAVIFDSVLSTFLLSPSINTLADVGTLERSESRLRPVADDTGRHHSAPGCAPIRFATNQYVRLAIHAAPIAATNPIMPMNSGPPSVLNEIGTMRSRYAS